MAVLQAFLLLRTGDGHSTTLRLSNQQEAIAAWRNALAENPRVAGRLDVTFLDPAAYGTASGSIREGCLVVSAAARYGVPLLASVTDAGVVFADAGVSVEIAPGADDESVSAPSGIDRDNPFVVAALVDPAIFNVELRRLTLELRPFNVFKSAGLRTVRDVLALGFDGLNRLKNFGEQSTRQFSRSLVDYWESGAACRTEVPDLTTAVEAAEFFPHTTETSDEFQPVEQRVSTVNFREAVIASLQGLDARDAYVLNARLGREGAPQILDDIGEALGVTRERARQRENRAKNLILRRSGWPQDLRARLNSLLRDRTEPLYLDLIAAEDPGFDGFQDNLNWLGELIREFGTADLNVWPLEGRLIVSRVSNEEWAALREAVLLGLSGQVETGLTAHEVDLMIEAISAGMGARELASALWRSVEPLLHFATGPDRTPRLVAIGRGLKPAILSIFQESDRPLHFREVRERLVERGYRGVNGASLRTAIRAAGLLLFGRSFYGTRRHLGLADETVTEIRAELVEIINDDPDHQWHSAELVEELERLGLAGDGIDRYTVGAILEGSREVAFLGRQIWTAKSQRKLTGRDRRDVAQLIEAVLIEAGRPLSKMELRQSIERARGLNETFLPQPSDRVIRLGKGRWGLFDRDCLLSDGEAERAFLALESILLRRGRALHDSEIRAALRDRGINLPPGAEDELVGRAQIDPRFRVARGGFVALPLWASLGRVTMSEAMGQTLREWSGSLTTEEVQGRMESLLERSVNRSHIAQWLEKAGMVFDSSAGRWSKPVDDEGDSGDDAD